MPKYYSPNLVQIPTCHGSLAYDYDNERRRREVGAVGTQLPCWLRKPRLRGGGRPRWRSTQARILQKLPLKYYSKKKNKPKAFIWHWHKTLPQPELLYVKKKKNPNSLDVQHSEIWNSFFVCRVTPQAEERSGDSGIRELITWVAAVSLADDIHNLQRMNPDHFGGPLLE